MLNWIQYNMRWIQNMQMVIMNMCINIALLTEKQMNRARFLFTYCEYLMFIEIFLWSIGL